ncbi:hypothetical protein NC653_037825 [Populus alba x Populus x berolinensis]|uniref:Uncharacterized protein n=1 Tax=Populus alba x Populus x berolinensis TaxID=444605 RepID=A0AAD6PSM1_9ROSI|nr:hypothetical protein NC653_037825 [Populus alba x Populus x berolinensis]
MINVSVMNQGRLELIREIKRVKTQLYKTKRVVNWGKPVFGKAWPLMLRPEMVVACIPLDVHNGEWCFDNLYLPLSIQKSACSDHNYASVLQGCPLL